LSKWAIKRIDRIHINFLWLGAEAARRGHCHINWQRVQRPKALGGLGILDLAKFSRALRLCWQWYKRKDKEKSWAQMNIPHNAIEAALFTACTKVTVANGKDTNFWHDHWLLGQAPKNIALMVYKLAWQRNIMVAQGKRDGKWKRGLKRIATTQKLIESIHLWWLLQQCVLTNQPDTIEWRFNANKEYSTKSMYRAQSQGPLQISNGTSTGKLRLKKNVSLLGGSSCRTSRGPQTELPSMGQDLSNKL
jgi:hypothetical protein